MTRQCYMLKLSLHFLIISRCLLYQLITIILEVARLQCWVYKHFHSNFKFYNNTKMLLIPPHKLSKFDYRSSLITGQYYIYKHFNIKFKLYNNIQKDFLLPNCPFQRIILQVAWLQGSITCTNYFHLTVKLEFYNNT